jgi:hypothetical protein
VSGPLPERDGTRCGGRPFPKRKRACPEHHNVWQETNTTTEEDITMFRFTLGFGRYREARRRGTGPTTRVRRRNQQLNCETLESRQLLSGYYIVNESSGKVLDDPGARPPRD